MSFLITLAIVTHSSGVTRETGTSSVWKLALAQFAKRHNTRNHCAHEFVEEIKMVGCLSHAIPEIMNEFGGKYEPSASPRSFLSIVW